VKKCPKCGATFGDDDTFCELDGGRLESEAKAPPAAGTRACPACGQADADGGDGYCDACGHRLDGARSTPPLVPVGAHLGDGEVKGARAPDELLVKTKDGAELTVRVGSKQDIAHEHAALLALGGAAPFPRVLGHGDDERHGAFLTLDAGPQGEIGPPKAFATRSLDDALAALRRLLDVAERVERAGFAWSPDTDDLHVGPTLDFVLTRLRGARPLAPGERLDAKRVVEAFGEALLPEPAASGPPALLHLLVPRSGPPARPGPPPHVAIDDARATLDALARDIPVAPDLAPRASAVCDAGLRRDHNEDAFAVAAGQMNGERWTVLVVCDGVSSSSHAEQASAIAAKTACDALAHFARSGDIAFEAASGAMAAAIRAAHLAVCAHGIEHAGNEPPGTTLVAGLVYKRRLTVGWVGDSRAYWVSPHGSELLTRDHSWANEAVAKGEMTEAEAMQAPLAHALTKCVGPLEVGDTISEIDPDVRARDLPGPGHIVLCTDGLWNYFPHAADVAALVAACGAGASPHAIARRLVNRALARGGQDNVTVAVFDHA
jgi:serine/threonine protein phosphatase PrpC